MRSLILIAAFQIHIAVLESTDVMPRHGGLGIGLHSLSATKDRKFRVRPGSAHATRVTSHQLHHSGGHAMARNIRQKLRTPIDAGDHKNVFFRGFVPQQGYHATGQREATLGSRFVVVNRSYKRVK